LTIRDRTFETYKNITLQRKDENVSVIETSIPEVNETINETQVNLMVTSHNQRNEFLVEYFYLVGCSKCEQATPVIEALMRSYDDRVDFIKYNAREEGRDMAIKYGIPGTLPLW